MVGCFGVGAGIRCVGWGCGVKGEVGGMCLVDVELGVGVCGIGVWCLVLVGKLLWVGLVLLCRLFMCNCLFLVLLWCGGFRFSLGCLLWLVGVFWLNMEFSSYFRFRVSKFSIRMVVMLWLILLFSVFIRVVLNSVLFGLLLFVISCECISDLIVLLVVSSSRLLYYRWMVLCLLKIDLWLSVCVIVCSSSGSS